MDGYERILYRKNKIIFTKLQFAFQNFRFQYFPRFLFIKDNILISFFDDRKVITCFEK